MRKLYARMFGTTVVWTVLLAAMTAMAGASASVLAANEFHPLLGCSGACQVDAQCRGQDSTCSCSGGTCVSKPVDQSAK